MDQQNSFFTGTNRKVILGSPTLQTTSRRICMPIRMPLDGDSFAGMPDWIEPAYGAVAQYLTEASPQVQQIAGIVLHFFNDSPAAGLFPQPSAKAPACELKSFSVTRVEDPDADPEIELQFKCYIPFTRDIWAWIGEMAGQEVYMAFPAAAAQSPQTGEGKESGSLPMESEVCEDEDEILAGDSNPEPAAPARKTKSGGRKKSGPKDLAAYHQRQGAVQ